MTRSAPTNLPLKGETLGRRPLRPISGTARQGCHCPTWSIPFVGTDVPIGPRREQVPTYGFTGRKSLWRQPHVAACHRRGPPQARALNKGAQQIQISHTSGSGRKSNRPLDFCPRAGWKTQTSIGVHRREIFRNRRFLNGVLNQGSQQSPAPVGLLGKGGARERTQVSPLGGSGAERTLRRRAAVGKVTRRPPAAKFPIPVPAAADKPHRESHSPFYFRRFPCSPTSAANGSSFWPTAF